MSGQKTTPIKVSWQTYHNDDIYHFIIDYDEDGMWGKYMFWLIESVDDVVTVFVDDEIVWRKDEGWINLFILIKAQEFRHPVSMAHHMKFISARWKDDIHAPSPYKKFSNIKIT